MRAAFSAMSPACGHATTGTPLASDRATVPWPAWQTTASHSGIVRAYETQSTSLAFAGPELTTLFVTTAREGMTKDDLARCPGAGGLFALETDVQGRVEPAMPG